MAITSEAGRHPLYTLDTWSHIFSFLPFSDLNRPYLVCKIWDQFVQARWEAFLHKLTRYRFVETFSSDIAEKSMTWKEAYRYSELARLLSRTLDRNLPPKPRVTYGNSTYTISDSTDVKIQKRGESEFKVLKGGSGKGLIHLAVENEFLFALRKDGYIVQYDLTSGEQSIIPTSWALSKNNTPVPQETRVSHFHVEGGYMIIKYTSAQTRTAETIPYRNPDQRAVRTNDAVTLVRPILVKQKMLYTLWKNKIFILDLFNNKEINNLQFTDTLNYNSREFAQSHDILFLAGDEAVLMIDPITGKGLKKYNEVFKEIAIIDNLLFGTAYTFPRIVGGFLTGIGITVKDLNTGCNILEIKDIIDFQSSEIRPGVLMQLVQICRDHCKKFIPPVVNHDDSLCTIS